MCVIAFKDNKKEWDKQTIKNCFYNNSDGAGILYYLKNQLIIEKGFFKVEDLLKRIDELEGLKSPSIIHFRIATHGAINATNCHPFLSKKQKIGFVHNGILQGFENSKSCKTDSERFLNSYLDKFTFKELKQERIKNLISYSIGSSKFMLSKDKEFIMIGDFIKDKDYYFSNDSYKKNRFCDDCFLEDDYFIADYIYDFYSLIEILQEQEQEQLREIIEKNATVQDILINLYLDYTNNQKEEVGDCTTTELEFIGLVQGLNIECNKFIKMLAYAFRAWAIKYGYIV